MAEPHANWYPFAKIRFQIRVENFADDAPLPLQVLRDAGPEAFGLGREHKDGTRDEKGRKYKSIGFNITPYAVNLERNSYRKADECRVTIPLAKLPFDPRVLRSATVQVFGGVIDPAIWAERMNTGAAIELPDAQPSGQSNQLFAGFVDEWEITMAKHNVLQVTARDITGFLVDAEVRENVLDKLPKSTTLDDAIRRLLFGDPKAVPLSGTHEGLPGVKGLKVVSEVDADLPVLGDIKYPNWFDSKKSVKKGRKRSPNDAQKMSYWDVVTDLCVAAGFIVYMRLPTLTDATPNAMTGRGGAVLPSPELVITTPQNYYSTSINYGTDKVGRSDVRHFTYGINCDSLKLRRKFGGTKTPTIEVRSWDLRNGVRHVGRFPRRTVISRAATSGKGDREDVQVFLLKDIGGAKLQERIDAAANAIYQQLSRGEFEVSIKTKAMAALPRNLAPDRVSRATTTTPRNVDADMFAMAARDPIIVAVDRAVPEQDRVSEPTIFAGTLGSARKQAMLAVGIREDLAQAVSEAMQSPYIQEEFRVQRVVMTWAHGHGWEFDIQAINFLDIRHAVELDVPLHIDAEIDRRPNFQRPVEGENHDGDQESQLHTELITFED